MLRLNVIARQWYAATGVAARRDVYLSEVDPDGAASSFLMHTDCPMPRVLAIVAWATSLGYEVKQHPPGNTAPDWVYPSDEPAPKPKPVATSLFD